jgi:hypothetical protein
MAVTLKKKRKIVVQERTFYWHVKTDDDSQHCELTVLSPDKKFIVQYTLGQSRSYRLGWSQDWHPPFIEILGSEFAGLASVSRYRRVKTPIWDDIENITPGFVRQLIEWCLNPEKEIVLVDWQGKMPERR